MNKQGAEKIEWCDYTWNPVTGCLHGCKYCYAEKIAKRFGSETRNNIYVADEPIYKTTKKGNVMIDPYPCGFSPTFHRYRLDEPQTIRKPSKIFVVSMGDLFGNWVPDEWIEKVFKACADARQNTYMFLTKNPKRYTELQFTIPFPTSNKYWYGTTVNNSADFIPPCRAEALSRLWGCKKFLSIEPLLGEIHGIALENLRHFNWIIIGQQTGKGAIPPRPEWVQSIIDHCRDVGVPVFVKSPLYKQFPIQEWPEGLK